jgi:thiopeptide-type bacteriocin biosynthesis protein
VSRSPRPERPDHGFVASGFFALRTPLLPFDDFLAWSEGLEAEAVLDDPARLEGSLADDRARLRSRLCAFVERPLIRDALFVASPDLDESLDVWLRDPDSERGQRIERAVVRYFSRMAGRPTPFGLFAGNSVGTTGDRTRLAIESQEKYERRTRLDMDYLFALAEALGRDPALRPAFAFRPNSSLYRAAGRLHYVEARLEEKNRTHHLVAVEDSAYLRAALARAAEGADAAMLAAALVDEETSQTDAEEYVAELIDSQILHSELDLLVTGSEPGGALATELRKHGETAAVGDRLDEVRAELSAIDAAGPGSDPARYREVARQLEDLPAPVELSRLFQVDMIKPAPEAMLGGAVLNEIVRGVEILHRLVSPRRADDLSRFREAFVARYEGREVALVEALDEEAGIGFPLGSAADSDGGPLLKGLDLPSASEEEASWSSRESLLLRKLTDAATRGAHEISLEPSDLEQLGRKDPPPLPKAFSVVATVAAASEEALSRGDFRLFWMGSEGPSGARLLGRFCDSDSILRRHVEQHLRAEEALDPEAVFAEVVHLPEGRLGNVLFRPVLRDYEIPFLGCSGAPPDRQIPITDLFVSASGSRIVLRSARLGRRVVPRLTSAHNFRWRSLGMYRFLCELQGQDTAGGLAWNWGPLWSAPFLPRVVCGRLVLSPAQWTVGKEELKRLGESRGTKRFRVVQSWRAERGVPRLVLLADGDNRLPIDLANVLCVEDFVHLIKDREESRLIEMFPGPDELCARGPEGRFVHELVVPFVRTSLATADSRPANTADETRLLRSEVPVARTFPPGSEWVYAKLYAGGATVDRLLSEIVGPVVHQALDSGAADRWFFIRYGDPDWHLRLRLHGDPARLHREVLPALYASTAPLVADGRLRKLQLDTYEREVERYGGAEGIELAEQIFQADSEAVLAILEMLEEGDAGADERWRLALRGIDFLLEDFGFGLDEKRPLLDAARIEFAKDLRAVETVKRSLGDRFRKEARNLERLLDPANDEESPLSPGLVLLRSRSARLVPLVAELKVRERAGRLSQPIQAIAPSYVHMHLNRMLRSGHRNQELVLYDFLGRLYESRAARAGRN